MDFYSYYDEYNQINTKLYKKIWLKRSHYVQLRNSIETNLYDIEDHIKYYEPINNKYLKKTRLKVFTGKTIVTLVAMVMPYFMYKLVNNVIPLSNLVTNSNRLFFQILLFFFTFGYIISSRHKFDKFVIKREINLEKSPYYESLYWLENATHLQLNDVNDIIKLQQYMETANIKYDIGIYNSLVTRVRYENDDRIVTFEGFGDYYMNDFDYFNFGDNCILFFMLKKSDYEGKVYLEVLPTIQRIQNMENNQILVMNQDPLYIRENMIEKETRAQWIKEEPKLYN